MTITHHGKDVRSFKDSDQDSELTLKTRTRKTIVAFDVTFGGYVKLKFKPKFRYVSQRPQWVFGSPSYLN